LPHVIVDDAVQMKRCNASVRRRMSLVED